LIQVESLLMSMASTQKPMKKSDESWMENSDFVYKSKVVNGYIVELIGGSDRGGLVNIWTSDPECVALATELPESFAEDLSPEGTHLLYATAPFMNFGNAKERYIYASEVEELEILVKEAHSL